MADGSCHSPQPCVPVSSSVLLRGRARTWLLTNGENLPQLCFQAPGVFLRTLTLPDHTRWVPVPEEPDSM